MFDNLRKINLKLNPEKCVFGVPSSKLLGFFVSHRGIDTTRKRAIDGMATNGAPDMWCAIAI